MPKFTGDPIVCAFDGANSISVTGTATGTGSLGISGKGDGSGVRGEGTTWHGVVGVSRDGFGVYGTAKGSGVVGESQTWMGVYGKSQSTTGGAGVMGEAVGPGVVGKSQTWHGAYGETASTTGGAGVWGEHKQGGIGVVGVSAGGIGVKAQSDTAEAVHAESNSPSTAAVAAYNNNAGNGFAIYGKKAGSAGFAGFFEGNVWIGGDLGVGKDIKLTGADCAEEFEVCGSEEVHPGTVMTLGDDGKLRPCQDPYDKRVVGVISGAGSYRPALVLDTQPHDEDRKPLALVGKVYCSVDATYGPIRTGDLLTTSPTAGHAMKAADAVKAFGAVIGKALGPLKEGCGLVPIIVALQ
jgi:hypothetical protein